MRVDGQSHTILCCAVVKHLLKEEGKLQEHEWVGEDHLEIDHKSIQAHALKRFILTRNQVILLLQIGQ